MLLRCCGSGSSGNSCALISDNGEILAIEAGCKFLDFKKMIDWNISNVVGCIVSHEHLDHARYIKDFTRAGIPVYGSDETQEALAITTGERITAIQPLVKQKVGKYTVTPFEVPHDTDITCYGYFIEHEEMGKLLFMTDLEYCKYSFIKQNINHIMIETNYDMELVDKDEPNYQHRLQGHMSIGTACNFISTNDNPLLTNVVLIHLSDKSGNPENFKEQMTKTIKYGADVHVAKKGLDISLDLCPF